MVEELHPASTKDHERDFELYLHFVRSHIHNGIGYIDLYLFIYLFYLFTYTRVIFIYTCSHIEAKEWLRALSPVNENIKLRNSRCGD